jgi:tellurite resistance protein
MPIAEAEAVACVRVLVAMAKADGRVTAEEKKSIAAALDGFDVPGIGSAERLLDEDVDVDVELAVVQSAEAREQLYRSAHFLANADGVSAPSERALLERITTATSPSPELVAQLARLAPLPRSSAFLDSVRALFRGKR